MSFPLTDERIAEDNQRRRAALDDDYAHLGQQLARRGIAIEMLTDLAMAFRVAVPSWAPGHRRYALRTVSCARRTADDLRETRGLRGGLSAGAGHARRVLAHSVGSPRAPRGAEGVCGGQGLVHRLHQLQYLPGSAGTEALLQVRQPQSHRPRGPGPGRRAQSRVSGDRRAAGRRCPHRLDRRRRQLPRADPYPPRARSVSREHADDLRGAARRLPAASSNTSSTSRRSMRRSSAIGARATAAPASLAIARLRSSISATTPRPSTSSRWWRS